MDLQKLKLLDDHIDVLRNLIGMISQELNNTIAERKHLLEKHGIAECKETECTHDIQLESWTVFETSSFELGDDLTEKFSDRSVSPTSPLDCSDGSDVAEEYCVEHLNIDDDCHGCGVHFPEDLPTPRDHLCLDHSGDADPDMNNALVDSDDDETPRDAGDRYNDSTLPYHGDDAKVPRPTSSLNNCESDSDVEEEDAMKPQCWISNAMYTANVVDMIKTKQTDDMSCTPPFQQLGRIAGRFLSHLPQLETGITLRSVDSALMDKASAAMRLSDDLKRMKMELLDRNTDVDYLYERYQYYKHALKKEHSRRVCETHELKSQLDEATSAKFIMFCRLQSAEARVVELEKVLKSQKTTEKKILLDLSDEAGPQNDGIVDMDVSAQSIARSHAQQRPNELSHKRMESAVGHHPLQESLTQVCKQPMKRERRGGQLQLQLQQLEKQKNKSTENTSLSSTSAKAAKKTKCSRSTESKKLRLDLSHVGKSGQREPAPAMGALRSKHEREISFARPASRLSSSKRRQ